MPTLANEFDTPEQEGNGSRFQYATKARSEKLFAAELQIQLQVIMQAFSDQSPPNISGRKISLLERAATPAAICYWLALFVGTHIPNPEILIGPHVSDKVLHFSAYFGLYLILASRIRILSNSWPTVRQTIFLAAITSLYSAFDEITQGIPVINRNPDVMDAVADCAGVVSAMFAVGVIDWSEQKIRAASPIEDSTDS